MAWIYLIAAPEDEAHAEQLADWLKTRGHVVRPECGQYGYPPARRGETVLALWSRAALMSARRFLMTNRAIDAWEDQRLVMVQLDHGLRPHGLGDIEMIDLAFEAARQSRYFEVDKAIRAADSAYMQRLNTPEATSRPGAPRSGSPTEGAITASAIATGQPKTSGEAPKVFLAYRGNREDAVATSIINRLGRDDVGADIFDDRYLPAEDFRAKHQEALESADVVIGLFSPQSSQEPGSPGKQLFESELNFGLNANKLIPVSVSGVSPENAFPPASNLQTLPLGQGTEGQLSDSDLDLLAREVLKRFKALQSPPTPIQAPTSAGKHTVFVSYSRANSEEVYPLVIPIETTGHAVWIDKDDIKTGQTWAGEIVRAIKAAEMVCLMCSRHSFSSDHVRREVYIADKYKKGVLPVFLDHADMPEDIEYFLAGVQSVDLVDQSPDERSAKIVAAFTR